MEVSDKNPNNVGGVGSQSFLASSSLIKNGVNDTAYINILSLNDGSLKTETVVLIDDAPPNRISEAKFSVPNDQLIEDALSQLTIDLKLSPGDLTIESTQYFEVPNTIKKEFIITGTVIDFYKNLPLPNASVILPLPGTKFTTKTNSQGKFKIKAVYPVDKNT